MTNMLSRRPDFTARTITNIGRLRLGPAQAQIANDGSVQQLHRQAGDLNLRLGSVGVKHHTAGTWLLSTAMLFPLDDAKPTDELSWSIGFDWTR
ncbi:MAG: hypothetical protein CL483_03720 [Acidobacteria bacterium]|nr:hypothetical protein [Acidobacteriota bacterium]|tara:strand:+ start:318 stop:599 length:282 start_codon:yes stop_codon:yes gene_type:complete